MTEDHTYVMAININRVNSHIEFKMHSLKQHQKGLINLILLRKNRSMYCLLIQSMYCILQNITLPQPCKVLSLAWHHNQVQTHCYREDTHTHVCIHTCVYTCTHVYTHINMYMCVYIYNEMYFLMSM